MALRKPLVINGGVTEQIQAGDTLDATVSTPDVVSLTNANSAAITIGQPVYSSAANNVDLASSAAASSARVIGLVVDASIAAAAAGTIQTNGVFTSSDWTSVIGATTLTSGAVYYLSATAGLLTATAPTTGYITEVAQAISTTELQIDPKSPIKL